MNELSNPSISVRSRRRGHDLAVIGSGSAGFAAAIRGAELGASVTLIGHGTIGGTCINVGCLPSKTLIRAMEGLHHSRHAGRFAGVATQGALVDWHALVDQKDQLVGRLRGAKYSDLLPGYSKITYVEGRARLTESGLTVNGRAYQPAKTIIATGAVPAIPPITGLETVSYLTSTTALDLRSLPTSMIVIGGGFIGCELAQLFARAGVAVTLVCRSRLLPDAEPEISRALMQYFGDEGITVHCGAAYESIRRSDLGVEMNIRNADGETLSVQAERVLVATGRTPNTEGLGLEAVGIKLNASGGIQVDDHLRATKPGVYAAGDVIKEDMYVYMAAYGGKLAADNALTGDTRRYDNTAMPAVTFTDPQVATVGLTEAAARSAGFDVNTVVLPLGQLPRALAARDTRGLIKLIAERGTNLLLGAHILAPEGGDSIQTAALAIKQSMTVTDLADMIFPYLTNVEGLKLAALGFTKDVRKLSCCAG